MQHHVIYIPGLGDKRRIYLQRLAVVSWRLYGIKSHTFQMHWSDGERFEPKLERLLQMIDRIGKRGTVSLVGASAGASAAINAYATRTEKVHRVVLIAGEVNGRDRMSATTYWRNPAFKDSMDVVGKSLASLPDAARKRILSIRAKIDPVVAAEDSIIAGARNVEVSLSGHALTIALEISFDAPRFIVWIRQLP